MTTQAAPPSRWLSVKDVQFETRFSRAKAQEIMHTIGPVGTCKSLRITREAFEQWIAKEEGKEVKRGATFR